MRGRSRGAAGTARSLFFNRLWIAGATLAAVVGAAIEDRAIALVGILTLAAAAVTWGWNRLAVVGLDFACALGASRVYPGDEVELRIELANNKPVPVPWLVVDLELSDALHLLDRELTPSGLTGRRTLQLKTRLRPYERITWRFRLVSPVRGLHWVGPGVIRGGDALGFFTNRLEAAQTHALIVYPNVRAIGQLHLPPHQDLGDVRVSRRLLVDPLRVIGIRDYRPEDPFNAIHWKATARQGKLQVRVAEPTATLQLALFANIDTFEHYWEGLDITASEAVIELTASLAVWALDHRYAVGVSSNGIVGGSDQPLRVPIGRGLDQRLHILEGLAKLSPYSSSPFLKSLQSALPGLSPGCTVAIVTSLLPEGLDAQLRAMIATGRRVVLVPVGDCVVPAVRGLIVRRLNQEAAEEGARVHA
jgi:uncharacterized protein (DUF58 family)